MAERDRCFEVLQAIHDLGVRISIDDYGTGYSSLAYLQDLPVDELKLDRVFIARMDRDPRTAAIVASTIALAHSLGLPLVAEGVETSAALEMLAARRLRLRPGLPDRATARAGGDRRLVGAQPARCAARPRSGSRTGIDAEHRPRRSGVGQSASSSSGVGVGGGVLLGASR